MSYTADMAKILYMLAEVYSSEVSEPLVDAWSCVMKAEGFSADQVRGAAIQIMRTRKYTRMPTPADIIETIRPPESAKLEAETQADEVLESVRGLGPFDLPTFDDPITDRLMKTRWPWRTFATELMSDQVKWWRKDFCEAYRDISEAQAREQRLLERREMKALPDAIKGNQ